MTNPAINSPLCYMTRPEHEKFLGLARSLVRMSSQYQTRWPEFIKNFNEARQEYHEAVRAKECGLRGVMKAEENAAFHIQVGYIILLDVIEDYAANMALLNTLLVEMQNKYGTPGKHMPLTCTAAQLPTYDSLYDMLTLMIASPTLNQANAFIQHNIGGREQAEAFRGQASEYYAAAKKVCKLDAQIRQSGQHHSVELLDRRNDAAVVAINAGKKVEPVRNEMDKNLQGMQVIAIDCLNQSATMASAMQNILESSKVSGPRSSGWER